MSGVSSCGDKCCKFLTNCCNYYNCIYCLVEDWATEDNQWEDGIRNRDCHNYCCCHNKDCCCRHDGGPQVNGCGRKLPDQTCFDGCRTCLFWFPCSSPFSCVPCCVIIAEHELADKKTVGCKSYTRCCLSVIGLHSISACIYGCFPIKLAGNKRQDTEMALDAFTEEPYSDRSSLPLISPKIFVA